MNILHHIEKLVDIYMAYLPRASPPIIDTTNICLVAHRGAHDPSLSLQENTLDAFERALNLGCNGIEFDVHATADEVLVVNHDATLKRLWGHDVTINALCFDELQTLVPSLPRLTDVVDRYGQRIHLFIELKAPFVAMDALADALKLLTPCADYHLLCLDETVFPRLTSFPKESWLLVPIHNNINKLCQLSLQQHYGGVLGHYLLLSDRQIKKLHAANQLAGVGFVDSKFSLYRELNRGIRLLFTNNAAHVVACLQTLQK